MGLGSSDWYGVNLPLPAWHCRSFLIIMIIIIVPKQIWSAAWCGLKAVKGSAYHKFCHFGKILQKISIFAYYAIFLYRLLIMMSIFLSSRMLTGKLPSTLIHVVIILLLKSTSEDPADVKITGQLQLPKLSPRYLAGLAVATRQVPVDCRQPIWFQASTWERNGHICTEANRGFLT